MWRYSLGYVVGQFITSSIVKVCLRSCLGVFGVCILTHCKSGSRNVSKRRYEFFCFVVWLGHYILHLGGATMVKRERQKRGRRSNGEGSIYLRKDGRWAVDITIEGHTRKRYYCKTEKEAIEKRRTVLNELAQGSLATGPQKTLKDYLEQWLEDVQKDRLRISTYVKYKK